MTITTKYDINDEVWFLHPPSQKAVRGRVRSIHLNLEGQPIYRAGERRNLIRTGEYRKKGTGHINYSIEDNVRKEGCYKNEFDLFTTKEELVESLKAKADNL